MQCFLFSKLILNWYQQFGRKTLPWQIEKTLYKVWLSEIMLQQTKVITVIPYFQRFIIKYPTIDCLASSSLDEILHIWTGLGYYARARNLHKTSKIIVKYYKCKFPEDFNVLISLPGIGRSTAGAILSLTLNKRYSILDGNVKRILSRYYIITDSIEKKSVNNYLWKLIDNITPEKEVSKFNQAMMDLGALVCTSLNPKCNVCPLNKSCKAYINNNWSYYPNKKQKKNIPVRSIWFILLQCNNFIWLEKCLEVDFWGGLFCFPKFFDFKELNFWLYKHDMLDYKFKKLKKFRHSFSHFSLDIQPLFQKINLIKWCEKDINYACWYNLNKPLNIGLSAPVKRLLLELI